ncbi:MAG: hypothetical protein JWN74_846 [Acidobacteriaceae bacterium]|nr:hypothetical protein [Acidobacteriaceae bacterium]
MRLRLIVCLTVVFSCGGAWSQTLNRAAEEIAKNNPLAAIAAAPQTASDFENPGDLLSFEDRAFFSKLRISTGDRRIPGSLSNSCPNGQLQCGDACCGSDQQCCVNSSTGGHYCAQRCN